MTYKDLIQEIFELINRYHPEWNINDKQKSAILFANCLTARDDVDKKFIDADVCPVCYVVGLLVTNKDKTTCFACGEQFTEVSGL